MTPAPNPDRRNEQSRRAILDATMDLIAAQSYAKVTIEAIAAAAGVGKQTIYRWWPSKGILALDAVNERVGHVTDFPDTGDIVADLEHQMTGVMQLLGSEVGLVLRGVIGAAQSEPLLRQAIIDMIIEPRTRNCQARLTKAVADGQVRANVPTREMVELLYGPLFYRLLILPDPLDPAYIPELLDHVMAGIRS